MSFPSTVGRILYLSLKILWTLLFRVLLYPTYPHSQNRTKGLIIHAITIF